MRAAELIEFSIIHDAKELVIARLHGKIPVVLVKNAIESWQLAMLQYQFS
jgi:hypothetical protein